jgi:large subunit ribosomal protein L25
METATIQGEARTPGGHHETKRLRKRGMVPAVIYGHGKAPETVSMSLHDTELALEHTAHVIRLKIDGREQEYLVKEVQFDHLQKTPIHVDLMRVKENERVHVKVPVELRGTPLGATEGGNLVQVISDLEVDCLLRKIPESIRAQVDHLGLNESLHVRELTLPPDVTVIHHTPDDIVAVVHPPRGMTSAEIEALEGEEGAASAEPEVIGKGKEDKDEGGE